jgi:hypothetical protein
MVLAAVLLVALTLPLPAGPLLAAAALTCWVVRR